MDKYLVANAVLSIFGKSYAELKKDLPIRPSEMGVLNIITETPGLHTPMMLAEALKVSKPMITADIEEYQCVINFHIRRGYEDSDRRQAAEAECGSGDAAYGGRVEAEAAGDE